MKTFIPWRMLYKTVVLGLLLTILGTTKGFSQYVIDGNYDEAEYASGQVIVLDSTASGTCEVGQIYAAVKDSVLLLGIHNGNAGSAIFRYYFDTNPNVGINYEVFGNDTVYINGADKVLQIKANDGSSLEVYEWDENLNAWVADGNGITAMVGNYSGNDKPCLVFG